MNGLKRIVLAHESEILNIECCFSPELHLESMNPPDVDHSFLTT